MNTFGILAALLGWLALGLETALKQDVRFSVGALSAAPSYVVPLAVFIAICATPSQTLWVCLLLGLGLDLTSPHALGPADQITVAGPHAIGLLLAGQFVLVTRGLVIRRNPLTVVVLSIPAALLMHIVVVAFFTLRQFYTPLPDWSATAQLGARLFSSILTGGSALVLSILLMPLAPALGLQATHGRRR